MSVKHARMPLLSLSIMIVTCTLFIIFCVVDDGAQNSSLPFSQLPLWLQVGLSSIRTLKKLIICGVLCSILSSALTILWFYKNNTSTMITSGVRNISPLFFLSLGAFLLPTTPYAIFALYGTFINPQSALYSGGTNGFLHFLLYFIAFIFCGGIISMVFTSSIFSIVELYRRFKNSASAQ